MDPYHSPLRSPILVPNAHSSIPYEEPGSNVGVGAMQLFFEKSVVPPLVFAKY